MHSSWSFVTFFVELVIPMGKLEEVAKFIRKVV